jgi:hypothetical protein
VASEQYALTGNMYFKSEVELMLKTAGFNEIGIEGDYSNAPAAVEHEEIVFSAIKIIKIISQGAVRGRLQLMLSSQKDI